MSAAPQQLDENAVRLLKAEIQANHPSIDCSSILIVNPRVLEIQIPMAELFKTGKSLDVALERICHVVSRVAWRIAMNATSGVVLQSVRCLDRFDTPDFSEDLRIHAEVNGSAGEVRFWAGVIRNEKKVNIATGSSRNAQMTPPPSSSLETPSPETSTSIAVTINVCTSKTLAKAEITINADSIN
ncbi:hypothetical protein B9Z55_018642 [Caenorhabditis nigoni]|uniref:Uncharacterized protein n=1 Tax=Caenorhabditis nigoni TaxID=1611254 RepID=A0A2G5TF54_9PELO|nr:hypothetical protein B9Z55_018642 [Caenorhabditis nigoni]